MPGKYSVRSDGMIDEEEAIALLEPLHQDLLAIVSSAWDRFLAGPAKITQLPSRRYKANAMSELMVDEARQRLAGREDVQFVDSNRFLVMFAERVLLQFKKVDSELLSANYRTKRAVAFDRQQALNDLPTMPRLTVGYQPDSAWSTLVSIVVLLRRARHVLWNYELEQAVVPNIGSIQPLTERPLVRLKQQLSLPLAKRTKHKG